MALKKPISRQEILKGLPAGRARTLLFLIEVRTVQEAARSQQMVDLFPTEAAAEALDQAFLRAITQSRDLPHRPTIQEIELYVAAWRHLVPPHPQLRAALAHLLAEKYRFTASTAPGIRAALGLDTAAVQQAYENYYDRPLSAVYVPQIQFADRLRWAMVAIGGWFETLPPFWQSFVFMMAMSFPQASLALSIAMAGVGPVAGIGLLLVFGVINMVTIAALAEAIVRNGAIRYGNAFLGQLAGDFLGRNGSLLMTLAAGVFVFLGEAASLVGVGNTFASFSLIPAGFWAAGLFGIVAYLLARQSLKLSIPLTVLLAMTVITLLLLLSALTFTRFQPEHFRFLNWATAETPTFQPAMLQALMGVLLTAYYGHLFVGQCAKVVLPRDPSGQAVIWGSVAAMGGITLIFCVWVLAVSGAIAPEVLTRTTGTVLTPLAAEVGRAVQLLGWPIIIFLLGLASFRCATVLFNLVRERLGSAQPHAGWAEHKRVLLSLSPVMAAFLLAEWLLLTGSGSFTRILSIAGVIAVSLFSGIFPMLLLVASRRKGEFVPGVVYAWLGHPLVVDGIRQVDLSKNGGQVVMPLKRHDCRVLITRADQETTSA